MQALVINVSHDDFAEKIDGKETGHRIPWGKVEYLEPQQSTDSFSGSKKTTLKISPENPEDISKIGALIQVELNKNNGLPVLLEFSGAHKLENFTTEFNGVKKTEPRPVAVITGFTPKSK